MGLHVERIMCERLREEEKRNEKRKRMKGEERKNGCNTRLNANIGFFLFMVCKASEGVIIG